MTVLEKIVLPTVLYMALPDRGHRLVRSFGCYNIYYPAAFIELPFPADAPSVPPSCLRLAEDGVDKDNHREVDSHRVSGQGRATVSE